MRRKKEPRRTERRSLDLSLAVEIAVEIDLNRGPTSRWRRDRSIGMRVRAEHFKALALAAMRIDV